LKCLYPPIFSKQFQLFFWRKSTHGALSFYAAVNSKPLFLSEQALKKDFIPLFGIERYRKRSLIGESYRPLRISSVSPSYVGKKF
jgi:hypothetical protein